MATSSASSLTPNDCHIQEANSEKVVVLGLKCLMTPPFLSLLEKASETATPTPTIGGKEKSTSMDGNVNNNVGFHQYQPMSEKLKASNFPISSICIGSWKRISRKEGELTAKLYFAKKKLVWEFLDGQLKSKMEVSWSDILSMNATMLPNQPGVLHIELSNPPTFFRELTPQPRKHTNWQQATDFTEGQAPLYRRHCATFPPGALDIHYEKLVQSQPDMCEMSKRPFPVHESPFFNTALPLQINYNIVSNASGVEQQQSSFHHDQFYSTPSMVSPLHSASLINPIITQGYNVRDEGAILNHLSHMEERKCEAMAGLMWGNQTTSVDSSMIAKDRQQQQLHGWDYCEYDGISTILEYPPPPPPPPQPPSLPFNYENHVNDMMNIPAAGNMNIDMYDVQALGGGVNYGYGGGVMSAADEEEVRKINEDERYKWLIPHILGTSNGIGIANTNQIENLCPFPSADAIATSPPNADHVQQPPPLPQGFADMHPQYL